MREAPISAQSVARREPLNRGEDRCSAAGGREMADEAEGEIDSTRRLRTRVPATKESLRVDLRYQFPPLRYRIRRDICVGERHTQHPPRQNLDATCSAAQCNTPTPEALM